MVDFKITGQLFVIMSLFLLSQICHILHGDRDRNVKINID